MSRILVLSSAVVDRAMIGPAIRSYEIARALQTEHDVVLAMPHEPRDAPRDVRCQVFAHQDPSALQPLLEWADTVVAQPQWPLVTRLLARSGARLIFDLYVPEPLELLEAHAGRRPAVRRAWQTFAADRLADAARVGHHLVCASEGQRDLWLGMLLGARALTPAHYDRDPTLRSLIDVVPFGLPATPPDRLGAGPRAQFGLDEGDEIVLWNGGIWAWLDAPTAVEAIARLRERRPRARLVFLGRSGHEAAARATRAVEERARALGLLGDGVLIPKGLTPYGERSSWLADADCAVSLHVDHAETRFAFRTRLLDCFWAGLPVVCTAGDELSDRVDRDGLGATVPERDPVAVAEALEAVLARGRGAYAAGLAAAAANFAWPKVVAPIGAWAVESGLPPRLGAVRRPIHALRSGFYVGARTGLNRVGLNRWPGD
ncbi:MAG: glycosyltransferase [Solirubrobacteraceae bacterium]